jgi:hypothetical protein
MYLGTEHLTCRGGLWVFFSFRNYFFGQQLSLLFPVQSVRTSTRECDIYSGLCFIGFALPVRYRCSTNYKLMKQIDVFFLIIAN